MKPTVLYWGNFVTCVQIDIIKTCFGHLPLSFVQYIPRNMHTVFALLCFVVVIHWLIFPYPSGLLHWHCGNLTIDPVPAKQPWWIWINTSCEFIMNDCITTTKQSTTKPCAYFLGYTVWPLNTAATDTCWFSNYWCKWAIARCSFLTLSNMFCQLSIQNRASFINAVIQCKD